jgi:hypothetical protein
MLVMRWEAVRCAPARDRSVPDEQCRFELYDPEADPGGTTDVHASARQSPAGGTRAEVWGGGVRPYDSGLLTAAGGPRPVDVDVTGVRLLRLVVRDANSGTSYDHTSWAAAHLRVG